MDLHVLGEPRTGDMARSLAFLPFLGLARTVYLEEKSLYTPYSLVH